MALITGAARRVGRQIAISLARRGCNIALHYRSAEQEAHHLRKKIRELGVRCEVFQADLEEEDECLRLVEEVSSHMSVPSVLVNNASRFYPSRPETASFKSLSGAISINSWAPFVLTREVFRRAGEASVVNLLDARWMEIDLSHFEYDLSKKLLAHITTVMAYAFAPGVRVNAVAPGPVLPPEGKDEGYLERLSMTLPLKKRGYPDDVARAVVFLIESDYITGQTIYVDGGLHLRTQVWREKVE